MAEYQKTIITNAGISVLNRVLSGKATATFTRAVSSTDDLSGKTESELLAMTGFGSVMQNGVCSRYDIHNQNIVSLDLVFTNENLGNSYMINTVGLYAKASDSDTEVLYAIARAGKDAKGNSLAEQMPAYAGSLTKFTISLYTQVGQADSVSVSITDEGVVKSINGTIKPDANGDIVLSYYSQVEAGAGAHNAIYRGAELGSTLTDDQNTAIIAGTFDDMFIGDYWSIGGVTYRIAAFDYYLGTGDTACNTHHVVVVPDTPLYTAKMNETSTTAGAYVGSKMYTTGLDKAKTIITAAFGNAHLLTHRNYLHNACTKGVPTGISWYDSTVELMTEQNVYGSQIMGSLPSGGTVSPWEANGNHNYLVDKSQFPLFAFRPDLLAMQQWFWLRTVVSADGFANVGYNGHASCNIASNSDGGVRPSFSIC